MMKKHIAVILALALLVSLTACGGKETRTTEPAETAGQSETAAPVNTDDMSAESVSATDGKKILTVYFSSANTANVDAVSSATPDFNGVASTELLATYIHEVVGGDIVKITPVKDYPEDYNGTADAAKAERDADERPAYLPLDVDPEDYDVIFVGYPMWWYTLPMVMYTFFDDYDFSGKTIVPFNTHAGSGDGGTYDEIAAFEPDATVLDGLAVSGSRVENARNDVADWLNGLNY